MFLDGASNFHPYECNGPGHCIHCDRVVTPNHDPERCALCADTLWFQSPEEDEMGVLSNAADAISEVVTAVKNIDLSDEAEAAADAVGNAAAKLESIEGELRAYAATYGDEQSTPTGAEVANEPGVEGEPAPEEPPAE